MSIMSTTSTWNILKSWIFNEMKEKKKTSGRVYLHLALLRQENWICKAAKNAFEKFVYDIVHTSTLAFINTQTYTKLLEYIPERKK
jgi:hypothetical protein